MRPGHLSRMGPLANGSNRANCTDSWPGCLAGAGVAHRLGQARNSPSGTTPAMPYMAGRRAPAGLLRASRAWASAWARVTGARASPRPGTRRRTACRRRAWGPPSCPGPVRPDCMPAHGCASSTAQGKSSRSRANHQRSTINANRSTPPDGRCACGTRPHGACASRVVPSRHERRL